MNEAIQKILEEFAEYIFYGEENIKNTYRTQRVKLPDLQKIDKNADIEKAYKKFAKMQNTTYWRYNFKEEYYKQAKFIEDLEDDYSGSKRTFKEENYYYNDGSYPRFRLGEFRLYITWRTNVLKGEIVKTNSIFPKLYINELLNKIHCQNAEEAIEKMIEFWKGYRDFDVGIDYKMKQTIKEFYVVYYQEILETFEQIQQKFPCKESEKAIQTIEILKGNYHNKVKWINDVSNYKIGNSKFLDTPYGYMLAECLEKVLNKMHQQLNKIHLSLPKILVKKQTNLGYAAEPLNRFCVYLPEVKQIQVELSPVEEYVYKNKVWKREVYVPNELYKPFVSYIVKNMECYIRKYTGYRPIKKLEKEEIIKYCDTYYYTQAQERMLYKLYNLDLEQFLKEAVMEYLKECNVPKEICNVKREKEKEAKEESIKVEFHVDSFANIRKKAEETQKSLIVEETEQEAPVEVAKQVIEMEEPNKQEEKMQEKKYDNVFAKFVDSLSKEEKEIIKQYTGKGNVKQVIEKISIQNKVMPELLISKINDKALESIGDTIIESSMESIYEEYEAEIKRVL